MKNAHRTDRVFKALADNTRRTMLDLLFQQPRTTGQLAEQFPGLSRFAVMKHLTVLRKAGLLIVTRNGRERWNRLNPVPLRDVLQRWMNKYDLLTSDILLNIRDAAESDRDPATPNNPPGQGDTP